MNRQRILYIGEKMTHEEYLKGHVPSHWFYGAVEMERSGHTVIWEQENSGFLNDINLIKSNYHDIIFIPNLNLHNHILLLTLAAFGLYRKPIYAYLHRAPNVKNNILRYIYKFLFNGLRHIFFLSEKSMNETVNAKLFKPDACSVPGWGPDMDFYSRIETSDNGSFVSTGKENRDFDMLIEAFRISGAPLHIFTVARNYSSNYDYLKDKCRDIPNINISILEKNTSSNYLFLVKEMAKAKALVCPLREDKLHYCVGLSTIADAEGLDKPLIITSNPYHDTLRVSKTGFAVNTVEEWVKAIKDIQESNIKPRKFEFNMSKAYQNMKKAMKL